jgi:hypothetical protein
MLQQSISTTYPTVIHILSNIHPQGIQQPSTEYPTAIYNTSNSHQKISNNNPQHIQQPSTTYPTAILNISNIHPKYTQLPSAQKHRASTSHVANVCKAIATILMDVHVSTLQINVNAIYMAI